MSTRATRLPAIFAATTDGLRSAIEGHEPVRLALPYPLTSNRRMTVSRGRSILSKAYRDWVNLAAQELMLQKPRLMRGRIGIYMQLVAPDKRIRDLDNVSFKGIIDLLVKCGVIEGDDSRYVRVLHSQWVNDGPACVVTIKKMIE